MNPFKLMALFKHRESSSKIHIKNLIEIAEADGHFVEIEMELLKSIAKRNGFTENQVSEIRKNSEEIKLEIPADSKVRFLQYYDLIHMMSIDSVIHPEEVKICSQFAKKFGYHSDNIQDLINSTLSCIKYERNPDDTMGRVILLLA